MMNEEDKGELPPELQDYYNRILLDADASNTYAVRFMEYLTKRDKKYMPEDNDEI